jgi:hypothetical protein
MSNMPRRSVLALAVLSVLPICACGGPSEQVPAAEKQAAGGVRNVPPAVSAGDPLTALLTPFPATGWSQTKPPQVFGTENLWEVIDGAAEIYLGFGFQQAATTTYSDAGGLEASVEVYRMADAIGAFGIWAQEADPKADYLPIGNDSASGANAVTFWRGTHYVKIAAFKAGDTVKTRVRTLAEAIASRVPAGARPPELDRFPPDGLVAHSVRYVPRDALGQRDFANAVEAQYRDGPRTSKLTVVSFADVGEARDATARYQQFVVKSGNVRQGVTAPGDGGFAGDDPYYGRLLAVRSGPMLVVVLGASSDAGATSLAAAFLQRAGRQR